MNSKRIKWIIWAGAILALCGAAALALVTFWVPIYLETGVIPDTVQKMGLDARQVHVRRIGWFGAELGPIHLDGDDQPAVRIAAVHIDYSPFSLMRGQIKGITLGGVRVVLLAGPNGISLPGMKPESQPRTSKDGPILPDLRKIIPIGIERIRLNQSEIVVLGMGRPMTVSVDMILSCDQLNEGFLSAQANLAVLGNTLSFKGQLDQDKNTAIFTIEKSRLFLDTLTQWVRLTPPLSMAAEVRLHGQASMQLTPLNLKNLTLQGRLEKTEIRTPQGTIEHLTSDSGIPMPIAFSVDSGKTKAIQWQCGPIQIQGPVMLQIHQAKGTWTNDSNGWIMEAQINTLAPSQTTIDGLHFPTDVAMQWQAHIRHSEDNVITYQVQTTDTQPLTLSVAPTTIKVPNYHVEVNGHYGEQTLQAQGSITFDQMHIALPQGVATAPKVVLNSSYTHRLSQGAPTAQFSAKTLLHQVRLKLGGMQFIAPAITMDAEGALMPASPWRYQFNLRTADAVWKDPSKKINIQGIGVYLPIHWPLRPDLKAGHLHAHSLQWDNHQLGNLNGRLKQKENALTLSLRHKSKLFPGLNVLIHGSFNQSGGTLTANLPRYELKEAVDVGRFLPEAGGMLAKGRIQGDATITMKNGSLHSSATLAVSQGSLRQESRQLTVEGIEATLQLKDVVNLISAPRQTLRVSRIDLGDLTAKNLEVDFQLEDGPTLFIEKSRVQWSQGRITTAAVRIVPGKQDYEVTLYCDRLNLAMVLEQLGAGQAMGEGTVNGTVPLHWQQGRLSFDQGFLYSTPGKPGAIQLTGTEMLLAGLPPDTPQHTQVDIATEALKDYSYKWAKLHVESEEDNLLLKLQFDGKPNRLLPFAFDQQLGRLKRVAGQGQADFKGISIDLNFNSPINQILRYKDMLTPNP